MNVLYKKLVNRNVPVFLLAVSALSVGFQIAEAKQSTEDKIKESIQNAADSLKKGVEKAGDDLEAVQAYLNNYHFKGILEHQATSGYATLSDLKLNHQGRAIVVRPGERIHGSVKITLDPNRCSPVALYRIVLGFDGKGPQESIYNSLGSCIDHKEKFHLIAPAEPGIYQIRFRPSESIFESSAFEEWTDEKGAQPDAKATVGIVVVK